MDLTKELEWVGKAIEGLEIRLKKIEREMERVTNANEFSQLNSIMNEELDDIHYLSDVYKSIKNGGGIEDIPYYKMVKKYYEARGIVDVKRNWKEELKELFNSVETRFWTAQEKKENAFDDREFAEAAYWDGQMDIATQVMNDIRYILEIEEE